MDDSSSSEGAAARTFKVVLLGDGAVGKSSVCRRFCSDFYAQEYRQTLGLDLFSQQVALAGGQRVTFNLYDIGGQSVQSRMLRTFAAGADCLVYVFSLTEPESLESLGEWRRLCGAPEGARAVLAGNKSDLATQRRVLQPDVDRAVRELGAAKYFQVSALTGDRVKPMFVALAGLLTGLDLEQFALDERVPVPAAIRAEDRRTATRLNEEGTLAPAAREARYAQDAAAAARPRVERARARRVCGAQ